MRWITVVFALLLLAGATSAHGETYARVEVAFVNLRSAPNTKAQKVGRISQGESFLVMERRGSWARLQINNNTTAWAAAEFKREKYLTFYDQVFGGITSPPVNIYLAEQQTDMPDYVWMMLVCIPVLFVCGFAFWRFYPRRNRLGQIKGLLQNPRFGRTQEEFDLLVSLVSQAALRGRKADNPVRTTCNFCTGILFVLAELNDYMVRHLFRDSRETLELMLRVGIAVLNSLQEGETNEQQSDRGKTD